MNATLYTTSKGAESRLVPSAVDFLPDEGAGGGEYPFPVCTAGAFVDPDVRFQEVDGIGGAMTDASAWTLMQMPPAMRAEVMRSLFAPVPGGGTSLVRVPMNSCDFARRIYSCCDTPGDYGLKTFNIDYDRECMVPMLKEALALHPGLKVLVSPWSPPAWMKTNQDMCHGGRLLPECRETWAEFFCKFIEAYEAEGIPIWGVTLNNEMLGAMDWDSLRISPDEERDFIRDHLGPAFERHGLFPRVKILAFDHNRDFAWAWARPLYADPAASRYVYGTAYHWYGHNCYDNIMLLHDAYPEKRLYMTEGCNGGNNYGDPEWGGADVRDSNGLYTHEQVWEGGERYARNMIKDFNRHCSGWFDWNVVVNELGGPRHLPNGCGAQFIYDTKTGDLREQVCHSFIRHFSQFLVPGARRILAAPTRNPIETTAFRNPDGTLAIVLLNETEQPYEKLRLRLPGCFAEFPLPARTIATLVVR